MGNEKRLIEQFTQRLKEAYPQNDRNNPSPAIYYDDFCNIVDEVAEEMEAVDVMELEIMHCKECRYFNPYKYIEPECGDCCYYKALKMYWNFYSRERRKDIN